MIDFENCDLRLLDHIDAVVELLADRAGLNPDSVLLVGADCREILHSALGHDFVIRGTDDTDIGIGLTDWTIYERIESEFPRTGSNGIRHLVAGLPVDIMPFGEVENPDGIVTPASRRDPLVVFGFDDVHERAAPLVLPSGATIRIPYPAGYAALKARAWIDRWAYGQNKDGRDIAAVMYWYQESDEIKTRLYDRDAGVQLLTSLDWDADLAAARVLGADARAQLSAKNAVDLDHRWGAMNPVDLARALEMPAHVTGMGDLSRRIALVTELSTGLSTTAAI